MKDKKVLIIDDDKGIRTMNGFVLLKEGMEVSFAEDGPTALAKLHKDTFDLILLDMQLPYVSGDHIMKILNDLGKTCSKVVLVSGLPEEVLAKSAAKCGAAGFIVKPYSPRELVEKLKRILEK